jgi:tubulin beta
MRELLTIQVGQCGNQIGSAFWDTISLEHDVNISNGKCEKKDNWEVKQERMNVFWKEATQERWVPRSIMMDLEPGVFDTMKSKPIGQLFRPDNFIQGTSGAGNNWAKGHYTEGAELLSECMDIIRREFETCESPQGFQVCHSIGGGTGSGMGSLLTTKIKEEYPDRMLSTVSIFPSALCSDVVVEPYNACLTIHQLTENTDEVFVIDNEKLYQITQNNLKIEKPSYDILNYLVAQSMSGTTCSLRFPGQLNSDLRKLAVNLIPFPRLHFFCCGYAPILNKNSEIYENHDLRNLTQSMCDPKNLFCAMNGVGGKFMTAATIFRGKNISSHEVDDVMNGITNCDFVEWIPNNVKSSICDVPPPNAKIASVFVGNTTGIRHLFSRIVNQFSKMFKRKAFLHWYTGEGMDEMEFTEAQSNIYDLISEY